jgi:hypothetical protein
MVDSSPIDDDDKDDAVIAIWMVLDATVGVSTGVTVESPSVLITALTPWSAAVGGGGGAISKGAGAVSAAAALGLLVVAGGSGGGDDSGRILTLSIIFRDSFFYERAGICNIDNPSEVEWNDDYVVVVQYS